ncbi:PKDRE protein, partial [Polypterus senegalus]
MCCCKLENSLGNSCVLQGDSSIASFNDLAHQKQLVPMCRTKDGRLVTKPRDGAMDGSCTESQYQSTQRIYERMPTDFVFYSKTPLVMPVNTTAEFIYCFNLVGANPGFRVYLEGGNWKPIQINLTDKAQDTEDFVSECEQMGIRQEFNFTFNVSGTYNITGATRSFNKTLKVKVLPLERQQRQSLPGAPDLPHSMSLFLSLVNLIDIDCEDSSKARESLLKEVFKQPVKSIQEAEQAAQRLNSLTSNSADLVPSSQAFTVNKLVTLSALLDSEAQKGLSTDTTEAVSKSVLSTVSSVLEAFQLTQQSTEDTAYQEEALKGTFQVLDSVSDAVQVGIITGGNATILQSENVNVTLKKCQKDNTDNCLQIPNCINCFYPDPPDPTSLPPGASVQVGIYEFDSDPYAWAEGGGDLSTSVTSVRMLAVSPTKHKMELPVETFEIVMSNKKNISSVPVVLRPRVPGSLSTTLSVKLMWSEFTEYLVQFSGPQGVHFLVNISLPDYALSIYCLLPSSLQSKCNLLSLDKPDHPYVLPIPHPTNLSDGDPFNVTFSLSTVTSRSSQMDSLSLEVTVFSVNCLDFDGQQNSWNPATCAVGNLVTKDQVHCVCNPGGRGLSSSFPRSLAAKIFVAPNLIDLSTLWEKLSVLKENFATVSMASTIVFIYVSLVVVGLKRYKKDEVNRDRAIILADNDPYDKMIYLLTTYTGSRRGAGTSANVYIRLWGSDGESEHHVLNQHAPLTFMRGDINTFLVTAAHDLGELKLMDVWHDNSGPCPDWYLSRIKVVHFYTKQEWYFMCRTWLRSQQYWARLSVSTSEDRLTPTDYFQVQILFSLYDSSLWYSVFSTVVLSFFNRLERLSCCVALDMTGLLLNLIFLRSQNFNIPDRDTIQTVVVSLQCAIILMVLHAILLTLFHVSHRDQEAAMQKPLDALSDGEWPDWDLTVRPLMWLASEKLQKQLSGSRSLGAKCCQAMAYILVVALIAISFVFISIYGLYYSPKESMAWVFTSVMSFFQSLFIVQPMKCLIFTGLHAFAKKFPRDLPWPGLCKVVKADRDILPCAIEKERLHMVLKMLRRTSLYNIPPELRKKPWLEGPAEGDKSHAVA